MNVYIIIKSVDNTVDTWEYIIDVYKEETTAELICGKLNESSWGQLGTEYYVRQYGVIEI